MKRYAGKPRHDYVAGDTYMTTPIQEQRLAETRAGLRPHLKARVHDTCILLTCDGDTWCINPDGSVNRHDRDGTSHRFAADGSYVASVVRYNRGGDA